MPPPDLSTAYRAGLLVSLTRQALAAGQTEEDARMMDRAAMATDDLAAHDALVAGAACLRSAAISLRAHTELTRAALSLLPTQAGR